MLVVTRIRSNLIRSLKKEGEIKKKNDAVKVVVILSMPLIRVVWVQFKNQRANYLTHHPQSPDKIERIKIPSWIRQY